MIIRYLAALALPLAAAAFAAPASLAATAHHDRRRLPPVRAVYSQRALRRARLILQLELLELKAERLERVRKAIARNLPVEQILKQR